MNNAEKFKSIFGIYATELWAMPEYKFLEWLNAKTEHDEWIPTTKRLPKEDGEYLVTFEKGYAEDYAFEPIEGFGIWQEEFDRYTLGSLGSDWVDIPVTAWMPLPEPYEAEES